MDPGYGEDLNAKLGNLSKRQQRGSENPTASKGQNQLYLSGETQQFNNPAEKTTPGRAARWTSCSAVKHLEFWSFNSKPKYDHSFLQQIFESQLCAGCCSGYAKFLSSDSGSQLGEGTVFAPPTPRPAIHV